MKKLLGFAAFAVLLGLMLAVAQPTVESTLDARVERETVYVAVEPLSNGMDTETALFSGKIEIQELESSLVPFGAVQGLEELAGTLVVVAPAGTVLTTAMITQ